MEEQALDVRSTEGDTGSFEEQATKTKPKRVKIEPTERDKWVVTITASWQKGVTSIIETGQKLKQAKDALRASGANWSTMFEGEGKLPFSQNMAGKLISVGKDKRISEHAQILPPHWDTLYELTRLTDAEWKAALDKKKISPEMTREQAKQLVDVPLDDVPGIIARVIKTMRTFPNPTDDLAHRMDTEGWNLSPQNRQALGQLSAWCDKLRDAYEVREQGRAADFGKDTDTRSA